MKIKLVLQRNMEDLCKEPKVIDAVMNDLKRVAKEGKVCVCMGIHQCACMGIPQCVRDCCYLRCSPLSAVT